MRECGKLPRSDVSREKQDSFASGVGALEVLKSFVHHNSRNIFARVPREEAHFGKLASERDEFSANDASALTRRHLRISKSQVAQANATQPPMHEINSEAEGDS